MFTKRKLWIHHLPTWKKRPWESLKKHRKVSSSPQVMTAYILWRKGNPTETGIDPHIYKWLFFGKSAWFATTKYHYGVKKSTEIWDSATTNDDFYQHKTCASSEYNDFFTSFRNKNQGFSRNQSEFQPKKGRLKIQHPSSAFYTSVLVGAYPHT